MQKEVRLRELKDSDFKELETIIRKTWNYDRFAKPETAAVLAKLYLSSCLANQTYAKVAEADGHPVGLILGKNRKNHHCPFKYRLRQAAASCRLIVSGEGRKIANFFKEIDGMDQQLLKRCKTEYGGEVVLFVLSLEHRGSGIGKKLFQCLVDYMKNENIEDFYLFTDTSCNFGFYEHQGMKRRQQEKRTVRIKDRKVKMEFYLYDMHLAQSEKEGV